MNLSELRKSEHLSASAINDYIDCSLLFRFSRIDRLPPEFTPDALEFGSAIHRALEELHTEKMRGGYMTVKRLHECFAGHWEKATKGGNDIRYAEGNDANSLLVQGRELLSVYYNKAPWKCYETIGIEEPFSFSLDGCSLPIIGAIDLIERDESGTIIITDFKTSGRSFSVDEVNKNFQLTLYEMALRINGYSNDEILLKLDCLIKTRQPKAESFYTTRNMTDMVRARRKIIEVTNGISKEVFIPNDNASNFRCKNCSYKRTCDQWFMEAA